MNPTEEQDKILQYPEDLSIPKKNKRNTALLTLLSLLLVSALLLACSELFQDEPDSAPLPPPETEVETPSEPEEEEPPYTLLPVEKDEDSGKYAFRSAWMASVRNLDFPKSQGMSLDELKRAFERNLDLYELYRMNAVILQVRPSGDALYASELNPPSIYVTGDITKGLPTDILAYAVDAAHERGMEFHAWFNPFRVTVDKIPDLTTEEILATLSEKNYARLHPEKVLRFDDRLFLNPGDPEVRSFVIESIMEVVRNYDIDAVHLDDYFYPYRSSRVNEDGETVPYFFGEDEEDLQTFETHKGDFTDIKEWRRNNTYEFMKELSHRVHDQKPYVKVGLSPFGIWGHSEETDGLGSDTPTDSSETYHHSVFLDSRKLVKEHLVDYIVPQIYWAFEENAAPFGTLARWWNDVAEGTKVDLYIGHANYKLYENVKDPNWAQASVLTDQMAYTNTLQNVRGSVFFRLGYLAENSGEFSGSGLENLRKNNEYIKNHFSQMAVVPVNRNLPETMPEEPKEVSLKNNVLTFQDGYEGFEEKDKTRYFMVYQFPKGDQNTENPAYLFKKIPVVSGIKTYSLNHLDTENYTYGVSAFTRLHEESSVVLPLND
ncbi:family 10 glycosylhydrolase [Proteiniclasticum sp.]|uniref:glycoside hydrolase family 10 protein n=1 Tax=Proteiniclasticum sp. TaxID=2053595 RepID=UPI0025E0A83F|nr:family 10 glycosylhydrolase [Proteiniclasticum sp.]